ncbi:hypothetical protein HPB47_027550 [Ixodes persulcatus]|uniref:Uncharacterized protein n=1 Tax=Ixodes persulcatus TaxID=34615 RepID=A0AC60PVK5_IXOPE|nr:hypothetical protein HPB47_027550 [Ixodes persulcatus]
MILSLPSKSRPTTTGGMVTALGGVQLPEDIEKVLCKGPKFSFEPSSGRSQLLAMVRQVGDRVAESSRERAVSEGVDRLLRTQVIIHPRSLPSER